MTRTEVAQILARIALLWPWAAIPPETTDAWQEVLADEPFAHTLEAIRDLAQTDDRPPTIRKLCETRRGLAARQYAAELDARSIDYSHSDRLATPEQSRAWLAKIRADLPRLTKRVP